MRSTSAHLLSQFKAPTLVVHCDRDRAVPPEHGRALAAEIPGARCIAAERESPLLEGELAWSLFLEEVGLIREFVRRSDVTLLPLRS